MKLHIIFLFLIIFVILAEARKRRRPNEIRIINHSSRNLKLRCQSNLTDLSDQFIDDGDEFHFNFYDFDRGNFHFWCDAYGLQNFFEVFDVFGETAPNHDNMTWYLRPDGLYLNNIEKRSLTWFDWQSRVKF